jgi:tetratricopeptide (TPR) repeat protein
VTWVEAQFPASDFVGRVTELAELRDGLSWAVSGRTQLFLLSGEPGIGKTRITREIASDAHLLGMYVAWGICCDGAGTPAYWPLTQVVRSLLARSEYCRLLSDAGPSAVQIANLIGNLGAEEIAPPFHIPEEPDQARFRLFDGFTSLLAACAKAHPLLLVLDDVQDADPTSWLMLRFIARGLRDVPVMIVVAYRDGETRDLPIATQVISDLLRVGRQIQLAGLSESEVDEMIAKAFCRRPPRRLVQTIHRVTGGNPFFLTEVLRTFVSKEAPENFSASDALRFRIPDSIRTSIRGRLSALPDRVHDVLSTAAALGSEFDLTALQRLTGTRVEEILMLLDLAATAGMATRIDESRDRYRFSHALVREALYHDLDNGAQLELHRRIVRLFEDLYRAEPNRHLDELAYHSMRSAQAGLSEKAIDYSIRAGEAAYSAFAYEKAARHWRDALALMEEYGSKPLRLAHLLERLADALSISEVEQPAGIESLERALLLYETSGKPLRAAQTRARLAVMLSTRAPTMNIQRALAEYAHAEKVLGRLYAAESQVWLYNGLAQTAMQAQHTQEALTASQRAMKIATRLGKVGLWAIAAAHHSDALYHSGRLAEASGLVDEAWHKADRLNDLRGAFEAAWSGGYHLLGLWDPSGGQRWFERELSRPRLTEAAHQRQILMQQLAFGHVFRGRLSEAREILSRAPRAVVEGFGRVYLGEIDKADQILDEARKAMRAAGSLDGETVCAYFQSLARSAADDLETAESLVNRVIENSVAGPIVPFELNARSEMALIAVKQGRIEGALEQVKRCREISSSGEDFRGLGGRATLAEAVTLAAQQQFDTAEKKFSAAIGNFKHYDLAWECAQAEHLWGKALLFAGEKPRAVERFDAALEIYRRHGAGPVWIDRVLRDKEAVLAHSRAVSDLDPSQAPHLRGLASEGKFEHEGDYWTISCWGSMLRLRNTKGLRYLSHLLAHPHVQVSATDLARICGVGKRHSKAATLPADDRRAVERSRVMVTKAIKGSIARIRASNSALGRHLAVNVKTGYRCVYQPDADELVDWRTP